MTEVWQDVALTITASDANGDPLNYSASGLPTGLAINSSTGVVSGAPSATGNHTVTVTVDDGEDSASTSFSWIVSVANMPPTINNPGNQAHETGEGVSLAIQASDADDDALSYSASGLPAGLSINSSGVISGTLTTAGNYTVTVTVDDGEDSASTSFSWSVTDPNTPPTINNPGAQAHETGDRCESADRGQRCRRRQLDVHSNGPAGGAERSTQAVSSAVRSPRRVTTR